MAPVRANGQIQQMEKKNEIQEEQQQESLHERIDAALLDLSILTGSLGTVAELMLNADAQCNTMAVGEIIEHYTGLINDGLDRICAFLTDDMRRAN